MQRNEATQLARALLDANGLRDWKIRLETNANSPYLGRCDYQHKMLYLSAHLIDQTHEVIVKDVILHEIAHALCPGCGHNEVWRECAKKLGSSQLEACSHFSLSQAALDAIRSGDIVEVSFEEEIVRKPKHIIHKLSDLCPQCGKVAKEVKQLTVDDKQFTFLSCGHLITKLVPKATPFDTFITQGQGNVNCEHEWNKTVCMKCNAFKLYPFQVTGCYAIEKGAALQHGFGLFDEMGLGKTVMPLAYLHFHPEKLPFLWMGKSGIKYQYFKEIVRWLGPKHFPQVITTGKDAIIPGLAGYIMSYDMARRFDTTKFNELGIKTIILDECQAIKNPDATRTQEVRALAKLAETVIPTSGTPWKNRGSEFFVALNMLDPIKFHSYEHFKRNWVETYYEGNRPKEGGIKNPDKFKVFVKDILIRRERIEVLPELPLVNRTKQFCTVDDVARKSYNSIAKQLVSDAMEFEESHSFANNAKVMSSLIEMRRIVGIAKVPATMAYIENFLEECDRKLVVFVHHRSCASMITEQVGNLLKTMNGNAPRLLTLSADHSSEKRMQIQESFNSPDRTIMIASTLASGEGLNLQTCSDCIMHERQWNPANEEQAEGRFIRIGQLAESVNAVYVEAEDTIDSDLGKIVEGKRAAFIRSMNKDGANMPNWSEGSIIKELVEATISRHSGRK